jgi:hydrogenase-4 transcriptional activator
MEAFIPLLLEVWREACRHIDIDQATARIAPVLARRIPFDTLLVRRLNLQRACVETVAAEPQSSQRPGFAVRTDGRPEQIDSLVRWSQEGRTFRGEARKLQEDLPGILPSDVRGKVLAGPLKRDTRVVGFLVLLAPPGGSFSGEHESMLRALLEPFSVALENDRQLHELNTFREAAEADNRSLLSRLDRQDISESIIGAETGLRSVVERLELVGAADVPVLILGETGSGKEVVARAVHTRSRRGGGPFLRVNCGAIPPELIDSHLFGHERGSFSGADALRKGWFERADGGTLFLDEIGDLPPAAQVRLLRILQDGTFERVGGQRQLRVDVRIVAATNSDLRAMIREGRFREDLWYRIAVFPVTIPPLRERKEDIPALAAHFALRAAKRLGALPLAPLPEDIDLLVRYDWPGNVRELAAVMERAAILGRGCRLEVAKALGVGLTLPEVAWSSPAPHRQGERPPEGFPTLDAAMAGHIRAALIRTRGKVEGSGGAAELLGINPHTLRARMRRLGVDWRPYRTP